MEKHNNGKLRVLISAAAILLISAGVFIASIQLALGTEESKVVEQPSANAALPSKVPQESALPSEAAVAQQPESSQVPADSPSVAELNEDPAYEQALKHARTSLIIEPDKPPQITGEAVVAADPGPGFITGQQAVDSFAFVATRLFRLDVDKSALTVLFNGKEEYGIDNNGVTEIHTTHENWVVYNTTLNCTIDAVSGAVVFAERQSSVYPGSSITLNDFNNNGTGITPDNVQADMYNSSGDIYISAARQLVTDNLADGRPIKNIMIDGVQFVWKDDSEGINPNAAGTQQVDCHVYMDTGMNYTLSFWGNGQLELYWFYSHPTYHACTWGYFYPEDGANVPPESAMGDWYSAPGVTEAPSASVANGM